ncbi:MAG: LysR family transcriptional regulator [Rhodobacteraceae bacterium]|nr:MAG: LysR family transcriptional regulator [Paracoccaceae bacterium]
MDIVSDRPDWSLIQSFLAVAEAGSLSGAAQATGHSQPTLGRHVRSLEARLGVELFRRHPRGLSLTPAGQDLLEPARAMQAGMRDIALRAEAQAGTLSGTVRIAASEFVAHHLLPPVLAAIAAGAPGLSLVLMPSDETENLSFREADIALRMYRPRQLDLVTRHLGDIGIGVFAARSYLDRAGRPRDLDALRAHAFVGYDRNPLIRQGMAAMGWDMAPEDFALRTDTQTAYWELVRAGGGVGFCQAAVARTDPLVEELRLGIEIAPLPVWLTAQENVRRIPRVAHVWERLAQGIADRLRPPGNIDRAASPG